MPNKLRLTGSMKTTPFRTNTKKGVLFTTGNWNAEVETQRYQEFGLGVQNEAGQRLTEFCQREHSGHSKHPFPITQAMTSTHGHHQMVKTKIRLIMFFAAEDGKALYSQQKQGLELTVA